MKITELVKDWERSMKQVSEIIRDHGAVLDEVEYPALWLGWGGRLNLKLDAMGNVNLARRIVRELGGGWNWFRSESQYGVTYKGTNGTLDVHIDYAEKKAVIPETTPLELVEVDA
jgi:hypothetical protein